MNSARPASISSWTDRRPIDVTTRRSIGITVACARCHDHKTIRSRCTTTTLWPDFPQHRNAPGQASRNQLGGNGTSIPDRLVQLPSRGEPSPRGCIHSMSDFQQAWSQNRNVRYTTDPNVAMGLRDGEVRDCEFRIKGKLTTSVPPSPAATANPSHLKCRRFPRA